MSHVINSAENILTQQLFGTVMGPAVVSQQFVSDYLTEMTVVEWEVANGSYLTYPLPYGVFASIKPMNFNKAKLLMLFAPGYFDVPSLPAFNELCTKRQEISELICSATVCRKVVAIDAALETGTVWSCVIEALDETHGFMTTIKDPILVEQPGSQWDENLRQFVTQSRLLVQANGTPALVVAGDLATFTYYTPVKCGWWLRQTETFVPSTVATTYEASENYNWPAVLSDIEIMDWELRNGGLSLKPRLVWLREGYNGPCLALVTIAWGATAFSLLQPERLESTRVSYSCPLFDLDTGPCLHTAQELSCNTGSEDEFFLANVGSARTTLATQPIDWPSELTIFDDQSPYKGGFLRKTVKVYAPTTDAPTTIIDPTVLDPASNVTDSLVDLDWSTVVGAFSYYVDVALDKTFQNIEISAYATTGTSYAGCPLSTPSTTYYARVRALGATGLSVNSNVIEFTTTA